MFFLKKNKKSTKNFNKMDDLFKNVACILVHAARIDQNYTQSEKIIIKETMLEMGAEKLSIENLIKEAEENEENATQILNFTKKLKESDDDLKSKIIEALWKVIYSNNDADMYETNLMRRLSGLIYFDYKTVGQIKEKVKENLKK
tara:strand:+ start:8109 stop:8543 length:435 start_codon:yes stop_codon:yes gene_type:complete